jgi:hypothetical protein
MPLRGVGCVESSSSDDSAAALTSAFSSSEDVESEQKLDVSEEEGASEEWFCREMLLVWVGGVRDPRLGGRSVSEEGGDDVDSLLRRTLRRVGEGGGWSLHWGLKS